MKITFIKSPTGAYGLAYSEGQSTDLPDDFARELIEANFAIPAKVKAVQEKETATAKQPKKETRTKK